MDNGSAPREPRLLPETRPGFREPEEKEGEKWKEGSGSRHLGTMGRVTDRG